MHRFLIWHGFKEFLHIVGFTQHWNIVKQECDNGAASLVETKKLIGISTKSAAALYPMTFVLYSPHKV